MAVFQTFRGIISVLCIVALYCQFHVLTTIGDNNLSVGLDDEAVGYPNATRASVGHFSTARPLAVAQSFVV